MTTQTTNVSMSPEILMSNLEFLAALKFNQLIKCNKETGKIELDDRIGATYRASVFLIDPLEATMMNSLEAVRTSPLSDQAVQIYSLWNQVSEGIEQLRDTFISLHDYPKAKEIKELIAKSHLKAQDLLSEKSYTALAARTNPRPVKNDQPIPAPPPIPTKFYRFNSLKNKDGSLPSVEVEYPVSKLAITDDLLKGIVLKKIPAKKDKVITDGSYSELYQTLEKIKKQSSTAIDIPKPHLEFDNKGCWEEY